MQTALENVLQYLTFSSNLEEISTEELSNIVTTYPYFGPAQLALAAKLKTENSFLAPVQIQKSALYFYNQKWMELQLDMAVTAKRNKDIKPFFEVAEESTVHTESVIEKNKEEKSSADLLSTMSIPTVEDIKKMMNGEPWEQVSKIQEIHTPTVDASSKTEAIQDDTESVASENSFAEPEQVIENKVSEQLAELKAAMNTPVAANEALSYETEPYYTIDYFASQGIKLDHTKEPQDRLSRQLYKFTDWLKQMKAPQNMANTDLGTDPELENVIAEIARTSNEAKEIVTETMAEVFVKQGKKEKAIQLYIKLSFLNPSKSTYFAAKLEQLKGI